MGAKRYIPYHVSGWIIVRNRPMNEKALLQVLLDLDADLAHVLNVVAGARIEDQVRPVAERVRTNASILAELLRAKAQYFA
jgi:hypothetical protein